MDILKSAALVGLLIFSCEGDAKDGETETKQTETKANDEPDDDVTPAKRCNQAEMRPADYDGIRTYWLGSNEFSLAFCFRLASDCSFQIKTLYYLSSLGQWFAEQGQGMVEFDADENQYHVDFDSAEDSTPTAYSDSMVVGPAVDEDGPYFYGQFSTESISVDGKPAVGEAAFWEATEECGLAE